MKLGLKARIRLWWYRRKLYSLAKYCKMLDALLASNNIPRSERKRFWREFYKRADLLEHILNGVDWDR